MKLPDPIFADNPNFPQEYAVFVCDARRSAAPSKSSVYYVGLDCGTQVDPKTRRSYFNKERGMFFMNFWGGGLRPVRNLVRVSVSGGYF